MSLMLVFVYSDFCTFILKDDRDQWQEMVVGWGGVGVGMVTAADVPSVVCPAGCLSIMEHAARAPLLCPGPVSDGQFYSPPESAAGQLRRLPW